jgi:hypothetical protein
MAEPDLAAIPGSYSTAPPAITLVVHLLAAETHRRADIEAGLAGQ